MTALADKTSFNMRSQDINFENHIEYLQHISTGIDLEKEKKLVSIIKALSNANMSMLLVSIEDSTL